MTPSSDACCSRAQHFIVMSMDMVFGARFALLNVTMPLPMEKKRSAGALVAQTQR